MHFAQYPKNTSPVQLGGGAVGPARLLDKEEGKYTQKAQSATFYRQHHYLASIKWGYRIEAIPDRRKSSQHAACSSFSCRFSCTRAATAAEAVSDASVSVVASTEASSREISACLQRGTSRVLAFISASQLTKKDP